MYFNNKTHCTNLPLILFTDCHKEHLFSCCFFLSNVTYCPSAHSDCCLKLSQALTLCQGWSRNEMPSSHLQLSGLSLTPVKGPIQEQRASCL